MIATATIRHASPDDLPKLERLLGEESRTHGSVQFSTVCGSRHVLVLDGPDGELGAAAMFVIEGARAHLDMLVVAKRLAGEGIEDRMISVIESLAAAFGAVTLDVPALRAA
jgi:ribosomal protein S18 acetylase RimI-like enzyme